MGRGTPQGAGYTKAPPQADSSEDEHLEKFKGQNCYEQFCKGQQRVEGVALSSVLRRGPVQCVCHKLRLAKESPSFVQGALA